MLIGLAQAMRLSGRRATLVRPQATAPPQRMKCYDAFQKEYQNCGSFGVSPAATATSTSLHVFPPKKGIKKKSGMEVGIQTAQLLMDERRRDTLKRQMKKEYPLVPESMLESSIDITAQAFTQVAPEKLKVALRPGGMERVRPELEGVIVDFALSQPVVQNIPILDSVDKRKLVKLIVTMSLDYVLQDAEEVLAAPEVRLESLEEQMREVKKMMGPARLFLYRVRHNLLEIGVASALSLVAMLLYQYRSLPLIAQGLAIAKTAGISAKAAGIKTGALLSLVWSKIVFASVLCWGKASLYFSWLQKVAFQ